MLMAWRNKLRPHNTNSRELLKEALVKAELTLLVAQVIPNENNANNPLNDSKLQPHKAEEKRSTPEAKEVSSQGMTPSQTKYQAVNMSSS